MKLSTTKTRFVFLEQKANCTNYKKNETPKIHKKHARIVFLHKIVHKNSFFVILIKSLYFQIQIIEHQLNERNASGAANVTALFSSTRTFADSINAEMNQLELKFLNEYNKYLRIFLPDNFAKAGGLFFSYSKFN
jgi:hypothetical protein